MPTRRQNPPRHRGTLACALLALLWCAWNYCADGDGHVLFWTTAFLGLAALAWPRPSGHRAQRRLVLADP